MKTFINIKKRITLGALTISIALIIAPNCFAKTIQKSLTPQQRQDMQTDRYIQIPTQQWTLVNQTNQPMQVQFTISNKLPPDPSNTVEIGTPIIEPSKTDTVKYQGKPNPLLAEVAFTFLNPEKGNLSTFKITSRMNITDINNAQKRIITVKDNGLSEPYIELE